MAGSCSINAEICCVAEQQALLGEASQEQLPVVGGVVASGQPADHVRPLQGRERQQQDKFRTAAPRQLHGHVIRLHRSRAVAVDLLGNRPDVITVVEGADVRDVIAEQALRLDLELALGHLNVGQELFGHGL